MRPGQRRSLTRRALTGIVPDELLNRKRKAYVSAGLRETILTQWRQLNFNNEKSVSAGLGIVDDRQGLVHTFGSGRTRHRGSGHEFDAHLNDGSLAASFAQTRCAGWIDSSVTRQLASQQELWKGEDYNLASFLLASDVANAKAERR